MQFEGGPYDGRDLPIEPPYAKLMRLPVESELDAFLTNTGEDPGVTGLQKWPHLYELDETAQPTRYRYKAK